MYTKNKNPSDNHKQCSQDTEVKGEIRAVDQEGCPEEVGAEVSLDTLNFQYLEGRDGVPGLTQPRPASEAGSVAHVLLRCCGPGSVLGQLFGCKYWTGHWVSTEIKK